jgi:hypothetical protein
MEEFMNENTRKLDTAAVEGDTALAKEGSRVGFAAAIAQAPDAFEPDGLARNRRQPPDKHRDALPVREIPGNELGTGHAYRVPPACCTGILACVVWRVTQARIPVFAKTLFFAGRDDFWFFLFRAVRGLSPLAARESGWFARRARADR